MHVRVNTIILEKDISQGEWGWVHAKETRKFSYKLMLEAVVGSVMLCSDPPYEA